MYYSVGERAEKGVAILKGKAVPLQAQRFPGS